MIFEHRKKIADRKIIFWTSLFWSLLLTSLYLEVGFCVCDTYFLTLQFPFIKSVQKFVFAVKISKCLIMNSSQIKWHKKWPGSNPIKNLVPWSDKNSPRFLTVVLPQSTTKDSIILNQFDANNVIYKFGNIKKLEISITFDINCFVRNV